MEKVGSRWPFSVLKMYFSWMKLNVLLFFVGLTVFGRSQSTYEPVFLDPCSGNRMDNYYHLELFNPRWEPQKEIKQQVFETSGLGSYVLFLNWEDTIEINITKHLQVDTFYSENLEIPLCICNPPLTKYEFCSQLAEGYCVDYYAPGIIRREGTFKNGDPIDTVKTYYFSGELMEIDVPQKKGDQWVQFYKNGNKKRQFDRSNGFVDRSYFPDGQLQLESAYKNYRSRETEYFQNGQLKRKERERKGVSYSDTGAKRQVIHRKQRFPRYRMSSREYRLKMKKYNDEGGVKLKLKFSRKDYASPDYPQNLRDIDVKDIEELVMYKNGKPHQKFVQTYDYKDSEWIYEVVNYSLEKRKWVEVSKHDSEILNGVINRLD